MHRLIEDHLEEVLVEPAESLPVAVQSHLVECNECREEVTGMRRQAELLHVLRAPSASEQTLAPRPGFYARVMERIEAQGPISIWQIFGESVFGRRIAVASMALSLLIGVYLISSERSAEPYYDVSTVQALPGEDQPGIALTTAGMPDRDSVLVNLVTYRRQ